MPLTLFVSLLTATVLGSGELPEPDPTHQVRREVALMGTRLTVDVHATSRDVAIRAAEAAIRAVEGQDALLDTWTSGSDLARVNAAPVGTPVRPAPTLLVSLVDAERWAAATGRAFEPAVGALVDAWDLRGSGRVPDARALERALAGTGVGAVELDAATGRVVRRHDDAWIDTGAFGKGAALRAAAQALGRTGASGATLDFGGQVLVWGEAARRVDVAHPRERAHVAARLDLRDVSAATSGASERHVSVAGERFGHVVDPRTGRPVEAWGSVTVVHADPLAADALSTALFVMGPVEGLRWATEHAVAALFLVERGGGLTVTSSPAMEGWTDGPNTVGRAAGHPSSAATQGGAR